MTMQHSFYISFYTYIYCQPVMSELAFSRLEEGAIRQSTVQNICRSAWRACLFVYAVTVSSAALKLQWGGEGGVEYIHQSE